MQEREKKVAEDDYPAPPPPLEEPPRMKPPLLKGRTMLTWSICLSPTVFLGYLTFLVYGVLLLTCWEQLEMRSAQRASTGVRAEDRGEVVGATIIGVLMVAAAVMVIRTT